MLIWEYDAVDLSKNLGRSFIMQNVGSAAFVEAALKMDAKPLEYSLSRPNKIKSINFFDTQVRGMWDMYS